MLAWLLSDLPAAKDADAFEADEVIQNQEANQSGQSQTFSISTVIAVLERMYRCHHEEGVSSKLCSLHVTRIRRLSRAVGELAASSYQQDLCPSSCPCMNTPETTAPWLVLEIYAMGIRSLRRTTCHDRTQV